MRHSIIRRWVGAATLTAAAFGLQPASAAYSDLVFFGDSLSDTGNLNLATGGAFPTGGAYDGGRFSNGPLWTEVMASALGQPGDALASLAGGNNHAFAAARAGLGDTPPGVLAQVVGLWGASHAVADPNALYVIVGGANDMRDARSTFGSTSVADQLGRQIKAAETIDFLGQALAYLASKGAKNVMIGNAPDLGFTPEAAALGAVDASSDASARFNALMPALLGFGASQGLNMSFLDLAGINAAVRQDANANAGAVFGITDTTHPCVGFVGNAGNACNASLFSDDLHPSAAMHQIIGDAATRVAIAAMPVSVPAPIPEPETYAMLLAGLGAVAATVRRRNAARSAADPVSG